MEIVITLSMLKWTGLVLFILSLLALFGGSLPDHDGSPIANGLRWVVWPLFILWGIAFFLRGLWL